MGSAISRAVPFVGSRPRGCWLAVRLRSRPLASDQRSLGRSSFLCAYRPSQAFLRVLAKSGESRWHELEMAGKVPAGGGLRVTGRFPAASRVEKNESEPVGLLFGSRLGLVA